MASQLGKNGKNIGISWCDATVNLWWGCAKVHTGCKNCYAEHLSDVRYKNNLWGEKAMRKRIKSAFHDLNKYQTEAAHQNIKYKVFCGSMMDIFEDSKELVNPIPDFETTGLLRHQLFKNITSGKYPNLIFLFLTKRPENIYHYIPNSWSFFPPKNVWFGLSLSNQETADKYLPEFDNVLFKNKFLSIEPQVGEIHTLDLNNIKWVIQGGESGTKKRQFNINWVTQIHSICKQQNVAYFFKQIDKVTPIPEELLIREFPQF